MSVRKLSSEKTHISDQLLTWTTKVVGKRKIWETVFRVWIRPIQELINRSQLCRTSEKLSRMSLSDFFPLVFHSCAYLVNVQIVADQWRLYRGPRGASATPNETLAPGGPPFRLATKYPLLWPVPVGPHIPCLPTHSQGLNYFQRGVGALPIQWPMVEICELRYGATLKCAILCK